MRIAVYGIGNVLAHDDAVGPSVVRMLDAEWQLPDGVVVEDLGTPAIELPSHLSGFDRVILVDAVSAKAAPGTIRVYGKNEILEYAPGLRLSPHDPALRETLLLLDLTGEGPTDVTLVGVVAELTEMGIGLSESVTRALPDACDAVVAELEKLGVAAKRRAVPRDADLWWAA
jgi:hydrogenase maturation protease